MQDEQEKEIPDFQDCFDGADIFFRSKDKERLRLSLEAVIHGDRGLAIIGANEGVLDHYSRILVSRLRDVEAFHLEVFLPNDTDSLLNRFNQILSKMTMEQARKPAAPSSPVHLLVVNDARSVKQEQWNLLARLIADFPGTNVRLILCIDKTGWPGYEKLLPMFGRQLYRWVVDTPTVDEAIQLTYAAQEYGYERDTDLLLEQVGLGDVVAPDNSEIMPGDIDILSEDTLMQDIGGGLVFSEDVLGDDREDFAQLDKEEVKKHVDSKRLNWREMGMGSAIFLLGLAVMFFVLYRVYPSEFNQYKDAFFVAVGDRGRTEEGKVSSEADMPGLNSEDSGLIISDNITEEELTKNLPVASSETSVGPADGLPAHQDVEERLAQISAEFSETESTELEAEIRQDRQPTGDADLNVTSQPSVGEMEASQDAQIAELIEAFAEEQGSVRDQQTNEAPITEPDGDRRMQDSDSVAQVEAIEQLAPLEQVEPITEFVEPITPIAPSALLGEPEAASEIEEVIQIDPVPTMENEVVVPEAPAINRVSADVKSVEGSRSGDFFVQYIVFTSETQATDFMDDYIGLAGALVVPISLRGSDAYAVVTGPFQSLSDARRFAAGERLPKDYWFRSATQLKQALRID